MDWIRLIMRRACRTGQIEDAIHFKIHRFTNVMVHQLETITLQMMRDIFPSPREKIVEADNLIPFRHQSIYQMGTQKTGTASH